MEIEFPQTGLPVLHIIFFKEMIYHCLWHAQRCKTSRTCNENCSNGT